MKTMEQVLEGIHKLPSVPSVMQELLASFEKDDADIDAIAKSISKDQVISAKVLRMANSAHYRRSDKGVSSISEAVVVLGFSNLRTLVIASGLASMKFTIPGVDRLQFWRTSLAVAGAAKWLGGLAKANPETCFTAGLLHGIGELLLRVSDPDGYKEVDAAIAQGSKRIPAEQSAFGFTHATVGADLAKRWHFPADIAQAILAHPAPFAFQPFSKEAGVVHIAEDIVTGMHAGHAPGQVATELTTELLARIGVLPSKVYEDIGPVIESMKEWEQLLSD